jgi:hypothetical protein
MRTALKPSTEIFYQRLVDPYDLVVPAPHRGGIYLGA